MASNTPTREMLATQVLPISTYSMILKTPTPSSMETTEHNTLYLSTLDQNNVRVYIQTLLLFPFPDGNQMEAAITALDQGLKETLKIFPFLAGTLKLAELGKLRLTYPTQVPDPRAAGIFAIKKVDLGDDFPHTYEELKQQGMPPSAFMPEIFCPDDLADKKKYPYMPAHAEGIVDCDKVAVPALRVQANFIPGGLVLSTYCHHTVMDCSGVNRFWKYYAREISKISHFQQDKPRTREGEIQDEELPDRTDESEQRRALDRRIRPPPGGTRADAEAYCKGTYSYDQTLPEDTPCSLSYFVIPYKRMVEYRDKLSRHFPGPQRLTICNLLAALVWIHVTRARAKRLNLACQEQQTRIGVATDLRRRSHPEHPEVSEEITKSKEYMGNMALFSTGKMKIADIVTEDCVTERTVVQTIRKIQQTINKVNEDWVLQHLAFFNSIEKIEDTECALGFKFGLDIYITSWMNFGGDIEWGIPGTDLSNHGLHGRPDYIRRTYGPSDGGMMIMPRRRRQVNGEDAPYEVMIRLASEDMETLTKDEGGLPWWAERIIE
ncbi:unnamed protein product [Periconia digitata]|uniref:Trichothecene 3-O-acetyltransferase-like N-terminal domain-containing protein n=1 Tax=Periconia digitata TaxID=1303443 RepID=A0A9W4UL43_9PLEO|nr:unnamed protein product [Periconia digitata]